MNARFPEELRNFISIKNFEAKNVFKTFTASKTWLGCLFWTLRLKFHAMIYSAWIAAWKDRRRYLCIYERMTFRETLPFFRHRTFISYASKNRSITASGFLQCIYRQGHWHSTETSLLFTSEQHP